MLRKKSTEYTLGESLDFLSQSVIKEKDCILCNLPPDTPILFKGKLVKMMQCIGCTRPLFFLTEHKSAPSYLEYREAMAIVFDRKTILKRKRFYHLDFTQEFTGHWGVHLTDTVQERAEFDLDIFWKLYIRLYNVVVQHLKIINPEAIYKNRIIPEKAKGFELFDIWEQWTRQARLSTRKGERYFRNMSLLYGSLKGLKEIPELETSIKPEISHGKEWEDFWVNIGRENFREIYQKKKKMKVGKGKT